MQILYFEVIVLSGNLLIHETSPYLLQHAQNPVQWYPWGEEAFSKAEAEDKPIFLSIGYSSCHWCHVMEDESFESEDIAGILNAHFVSIKVDREERPDIDNLYMRFCQAFTGGGGWPTSLFLTPEKKPFFAGTYFPPDHFRQLLRLISHKWSQDRESLLESGDEVTEALKRSVRTGKAETVSVQKAVDMLRRNFDKEYGGFGSAPKFPSPHVLLFLLHTAPEMAEKTLQQMYKGGLFDHVGYGFSRYSTDRYFLVPHFEKMLYDNALLANAYLLAYEKTGKALYRTVAEKIFIYVEREMTSDEGGFFAAQDADSEGVEGKYYVFTPDEITDVLGREDGIRFCHCYDITAAGNFEGKSIPNLIYNTKPDPVMETLLPRVYAYRKTRTPPFLDHKILTAWNALMLSAYANAYRILKEERYKTVAERAFTFLEQSVADGENLFVGVTKGRRSGPGYLDEYAYYTYACICLYQATKEERYLARASALCDKTIDLFFDHENGGFFFSGLDNEKLLLDTKETYDGAMPSGNSVMVYNLSRLAGLTKEERYDKVLTKQKQFLNAEAAAYPPGFCFYLYATQPVKEVVCVPQSPEELEGIQVKTDWIFRVGEESQYPLVDGKTTFYVCQDGACQAPTHRVPD